METINRLLLNVLSDDLEASKAFYTTLFDFEVDYDSDWFVHLISTSHQLELGIMSVNSDILPAGIQPHPQGFYTTLVVSAVDSVFEAAKASAVWFSEAPKAAYLMYRRLFRTFRLSIFKLPVRWSTPVVPPG